MTAGHGPHLDLSRPLNVHVVGAGGAGMSAIAAVLVPDGECTGERLSGIVESLRAEPGRLSQMAAAAAASGHRDAADKVAALVESVCEGAA